jgi:hypothetical protein
MRQRPIARVDASENRRSVRAILNPPRLIAVVWCGPRIYALDGLRRVDKSA